MKNSRAMNVTLKDFCKENDVPNLGGNFRDSVFGKLIHGNKYALSSWLNIYRLIQKEESIVDSRKKEIRKNMRSNLFNGFNYFDIHKWKEHLNIISTIDPLEDFPKLSGETLEELSAYPNIEVGKQGPHNLIHLYLKDVPFFGITGILKSDHSENNNSIFKIDFLNENILLGYFHDHGNERVYIAPTFFPGGLQAQLNNEMSGIVPCFECGDAIIYDYGKYNF